MSLEALIFDVDGTLAETEELHRKAFNATFHQAGLDWHWSRETYRQLLTTTGGKERIGRYCGEIGATWLDADAIARLHKKKTGAYARLMATGGLSPRPGVMQLIEAARAAGLKLAIATTTSPKNVDALCLALWDRPANKVFDAICAGDEVAEKKPSPAVYRLALQRLGVAPERALAFEDSRNGLVSARGAGLRCVVTPGFYTEGEDFSGAFRLLPSLEGFDLGAFLTETAL